MAPDRGGIEAQLAHALLEHYPDEAAALFETARPVEAVALLGAKSSELAVSVLKRLTPRVGAGVLAELGPQSARRLIPELNPNRVAAMMGQLDPEERERALSALDASFAKELRALAEYPPDTAGALMDPRATAFRPDTPVVEVVRRIRSLRDRRIQDVFVVDAEGILGGSVSLEDLLLADHGARLDGLIRSEPISVQAIASREEVAEVLAAHRLGSLPVVDFGGRLLGVLRQRELVQAAEERATASAVTMVGASELERALSTPGFAIRKRLPWLQINLVTAFLAAAVVGVFEETIARVTALAVLLPVVAGQSGNTGAQALAITMRGLALREVRVRHWLRVSLKEVLAGAGNGLAVGLTTSAAVYWWSGSGGLAIVIGVSMILSMSLAGLAGAAIPMLLTALKQDPAQSSSIILTTVTDVVGFSSFLGIASLLIHML